MVVLVALGDPTWYAALAATDTDRVRSDSTASSSTVGICTANVVCPGGDHEACRRARV